MELLIKFCCRLSLFISIYFYRYLHTNKLVLLVNTINFIFYRYYWNYEIALPVAVILILFRWRTGKSKTHILLYIVQHPRHFFNFGINLNEFVVTYNLVHNILELYNVLIQTRLTTSKTKRDI